MLKLVNFDVEINNSDESIKLSKSYKKINKFEIKLECLRIERERYLR